MVDYDYILSRTTAVLPNTRPETRRAIYDQLRSSLHARLRSAQPPASDEQIAAEELLLDEAIARVEKKFETEPASPPPPSNKQPTDRKGASGWLTDILARASHEDTPAASKAAKSPPKEPARSVVSDLPNKKPKGEETEPEKKSVEAILAKLQTESAGIEAAALISRSGTMLASALREDMGTTRVAGMAMTLQNLGGRAAVELARGEAREIIVRGDLGYAIMIKAGDRALLLALANENCKLGLVFFDMVEAAKALEVALADSDLAGSNSSAVPLKSIPRAITA
jgi:predicted regulator of Ras-like GTPase activity (Roadblock/LC7/MglB family)